jgi:hypothetical protein
MFPSACPRDPWDGEDLGCEGRGFPRLRKALVVLIGGRGCCHELKLIERHRRRKPREAEEEEEGKRIDGGSKRSRPHRVT